MKTLFYTKLPFIIIIIYQNNYFLYEDNQQSYFSNFQSEREYESVEKWMITNNRKKKKNLNTVFVFVIDCFMQKRKMVLV